jgi:hypothetical protein
MPTGGASDRNAPQGASEDRMSLSRAENDISDEVPWSDRVTDYDRDHNAAYLRLINAAFEGTSHHEMSKIVLGIDPTEEPDRASRALSSRLARAFWMMRVGWQQLVD